MANLAVAIVAADTVTPQGLVTVDLGIDEDGRIAAVGRPGSVQAPERIDASGLVAIPGGVDLHVHANTFFGGTTTRDDFLAATSAALFGGTTTIAQFAIPRPGETSLQAVERTHSEARSDVVADYVVHGAVVRDSFEDSLAQFEALRESGVGTVKIFSAYTDSIGLTLDQIRRVFAAAADAGITVFVHAETDSLVRDGIEQAARTFDLGPRAHARSRTPIAESDAVDVIGDLARAMGAAIYFVHISGAGSVASLAERKGRGDTIVAETCPHYLFLDESVYDRPAGHRWICSPPLRSAADRAALWDGLRQGVIDTVSSDHNCFDNAQKDAGATDFRQVPNGLPGVETRLPLLVGAAIEGRIDWARLVQVVSEAPARVIGLWPRKGTLAVGADADIALIDPAGNTDLGSGHMSTDFWPFEGVRSRGSLAAVYRRGERVVSDGRLSATPGSGSWLPIGREGQPGVAPRATS